MDRLAAGGESQEDELMTSDLQRRLKPLIASLPKKLRDALLLAGRVTTPTTRSGSC